MSRNDQHQSRAELQTRRPDYAGRWIQCTVHAGRVDFGGGFASICLAAQVVGSVPAGTCSAISLGTTPGNRAVHSYATVKGDDWSYGYNVSSMYRVKSVETTRIGAAYCSSIKQKLTDDATFSRSAAFNAFLTAVGSSAFTNTAATTNIDLPATFSVSTVHAFNALLEILGDTTWTQWSKFKELRVTDANAAQPDSVTTENWNNTLRHALGLSYKLDSRVKLRTGVALDQTPIPDAQHRTPRIPDNDRTWLSLGLTYTSSERLSCDVCKRLPH